MFVFLEYVVYIYNIVSIGHIQNIIKFISGNNRETIMNALDINKTDVMKYLLTTDYIQKQINKVIITIVSLIFKSIIISNICTYMEFNIIIDFVGSITLNIIASLYFNIIYKYMECYEQYFQLGINIVIKHYTYENLLIWKKIIFMIINTILIFVVYFTTMTKGYIIKNIVEFMLSAIIIDLIKNHNIINRIFRRNPTVKIYTNIKIDKYYDNKKNNQDNQNEQVDKNNNLNENNQKEIKAVCKDIIDEYYSKIEFDKDNIDMYEDVVIVNNFYK